MADRDYHTMLKHMEAEATELEDRLVRLRRIIAELHVLVNPSAQQQLALPAMPIPPRARSAENGTSHQRGDTVRLVLDAVEEQEGVTASNLARQLEHRVTSSAKNKRKLIHNSVSYLVARERLIKDPASGALTLPRGSRK